MIVILFLNIVQKFVLKPYYLRRQKQKALEKKEVSLNQVRISNSLRTDLWFHSWFLLKIPTSLLVICTLENDMLVK